MPNPFVDDDTGEGLAGALTIPQRDVARDDDGRPGALVKEPFRTGDVRALFVGEGMLLRVVGVQQFFSAAEDVRLLMDEAGELAIEETSSLRNSSGKVCAAVG